MKQYKQLILMSLAALATSLSAGASGIETYGMDHVGVTVPDLNQAVSFFRDTFGCEPVTRIGPFPTKTSMANDRKSQVTPRSESVTLVMIRCGSGSNIELFEYKNSKGRTVISDHEDLGAQHIAFSVKDVHTGVAYLRSKGLTVVGEPMTMTSGDTAGETWVHFMSPWGLELELVESIHGKAYEKTHPKTKLWSPARPNQ